MSLKYLSDRWQLHRERTFETTAFSSKLQQERWHNTTEQEWPALAGTLACNRTSGVDCACTGAACQFHCEHSSHLWPTAYQLYQLDVRALQYLAADASEHAGAPSPGPFFGHLCRVHAHP